MVVQKIRMTAALIVLAALLHATAFAADGQVSTEERCRQLEEKYGISIQYERNDEGNPVVGSAELMTLDTALSNVTPNVVRQISSYYQKKTGNKLRFAYTYSDYDTGRNDIAVVGDFEVQKAAIRLFLPSDRNSITTGSGPLAIVHELGHAYHHMAEDYYGAEKLQREWTALNGGVGYAQVYNRLVFMSAYGAITYREDFAEVFAHAFIRNKEGQGISHRLTSSGGQTPLSQKITYLESMLSGHLTGAETAIENLRRVRTASVFLEYQDWKLSDEDMEYIGYPAPRGIYSGLLKAHGIAARNAEWDRDRGGWRVYSDSGMVYLLLPSGKCYELNRMRSASSAA